jgi:CDP-glycerol glycerophosphotransferase (TagB/SpsB family)
VTRPDRWRATLALLLGTLAHLLTARLTDVVGRDDSRWVFGARLGSGFVDNARYLFEHAAERPDVRAVWLSTDPETVATVRAAGYEAYHARSLRGRWLAFRAGVVVVTHGPRDVSLPWTGGAFVANLWHGVPLKTIGFDAELADRSWLGRHLHRTVADAVDFVVSPSPMALHWMVTGLGVPRERVHVLPYPRYDPLVGESTGDDAAADRVAALAERGPLVCYLPTFRERGADLADRVDVAALDRLLATRGARLVVKPHPFETATIPDELGHVTALDEAGELSATLRHVDVLVTDYSSVLVDFLLLDRPVVCYAPDLDAYREQRGFYVDYESFVPGPVVTDDDALVDAVGRALDDDPDAPRRRALRRSFLTDPGDHPSETVFAAIRAAAGAR